MTAAAGGVLVAHRSAQDSPDQRYLVLTADVAAGQQVTAEVLGSVAIDLPSTVDGIPEGDAPEVLGRIAGQPLAASTLLADRDLVERDRFLAGAGTEVTVTLDPSRTPLGDLEVGRSVTVMSSSEAGTRVLGEDVRIAGIEAGSDAAGIGPGAGVLVTLGVGDLEEATDLVDAAVAEELSIVVRAPGDSARPPSDDSRESP